MKVSIYKRKGTRNWSLRYRDGEGVVRRVSTGTPDESVARQVADRREAELAKWSAPTDEDEGARTGTEPGEGGADPLDRQIAEFEHLLLKIVRYQAQSQEIAAKRVAELLRRLMSRTRQLENRVAEATEA